MVSSIKGLNNCIDTDKIKSETDLSIDVVGNNNHIEFGEGSIANKLRLVLYGNNHTILIGSDVRLSGLVSIKGTDGGRFCIGKGSSVMGTHFIIGEGQSITIGENCMFSWGIEVRATDSHPIFEMDTDNRVNNGEPIQIDDNVWVGQGAAILKGTHISSGSVVGIRSLVSGQFSEKNVVIAGVPAKIVKRNIYWKPDLLG